MIGHPGKDLGFWATFAQGTHSMMTETTSSRLYLKKNDHWSQGIFRRLFSGGIRVPSYLRGKTREIELVTSLTSCQGILTSFFPRKTHVIELVMIITSNHFILTSFSAKNS